MEIWRSDLEREGYFGRLQKGALCAPKCVAGGPLATWDGGRGDVGPPAGLGSGTCLFGCQGICSWTAPPPPTATAPQEGWSASLVAVRWWVVVCARLPAYGP